MLWPITLFLIFRRRPMIWIGGAMAAMMAVRVVLWRDGASLDHLGFDLYARPVGLLAGSLLALMPVKPRLPGWTIAAALGFLVTIGATGITSGWLFVLSPLAVSVATAVVIVAAKTDGPLAWSPVAYVGRISYGLYLYSFPIFMLGERFKIQNPFHLYAIGLTALIFATAALSYEFVEKPFLRLKDRPVRAVAPVVVDAV